MAIETYDAREVNVVVAGTVITGFADKSIVKIEPNSDTFTPYVGAKGEVARSRNADRSGKITITLKHTSPSNNFLSKLAKSNDTFAVSVTHSLDGQVASGVDCWVTKKPGLEYSEKITEREWVIFVPELEME